jgi:hypothetical protein
MYKITKLPNNCELLEYDNGNKYYYIDTGNEYYDFKYHREDGPALEYTNGDKIWYINGKCHREDGPAVEYADGTKCWYINDKQISCTTQKQFEQLMRLKAFW